MTTDEHLVIGLADSGENEEVACMRTYVEAVRRGGHLPLVLPATTDAREAALQLSRIDLLLLMGGAADVDASHYGCSRHPMESDPNPLRDDYELLLLREAVRLKVPVVGICRGLQVINIFFGGSLFQDLPSLHPNRGNLVDHSRPDKKWEGVHSVAISPSSRLSRVLGVEQAEVNSTHHQAVDRLGDGLVATAYSADGVIEAIEHQRLPMAAVQFHPERLAWGDDSVFTRLFTHLMRFAGMRSFLFPLFMSMVIALASCAGAENGAVDDRQPSFAPDTLSAWQPMADSLFVGAAEGIAPVDSIGVPDFVCLSDVAPDIMQEIRYYTSFNFVGCRLPGYEAPKAYLTRVAADSLMAVSRDLRQRGYLLKVFDAYRPQQAVGFFIRWARQADDQRMKEYFYPDCPKSELFLRGYIAHKSGHTRGSTVDVTLFDLSTQRDVDMGSTYDLLGEASHYAYAGELTAEQRDHRRLLREVMHRHGFRPVDCEWWHFTLRNEPYPNTYFTFPIR